ncbi:hypothetical protein CMU23_01470 [Elizabethkingia anophelis]|nr:hypothetical protein [Elizabethkingia anophelis]MDV3830502.1 hypothetical protein [Elizabethkingia anophelis]
MDELYEKLIELLESIPEINYIDLDAGQLQEQNPPLSYPAILVSIEDDREDINKLNQSVDGKFTLTIINKLYSETNSLAPKEQRVKGLSHLKLVKAIQKKLQGYEDERFRSFTNKGNKDPKIRKGLKTAVLQWETSWIDSYNSN